MEASREGHEDVVQLLVEYGKYSPNYVPSTCYSLYYFSSLPLFFLGANINAQTEETQETALTLAYCGGFLEVAQFLIDHGADIELGASTPLMEASQEGHIDIVKHLISKGSNINAITNTMDTALTYACANGHTRIAEFLISCGADVVSYNAKIDYLSLHNHV